MSKEHEYLPEHHEELDEWHEHTPVEGPPQAEHASHVNTTMLGIIFLGTVASVVLIVGLVAVYFVSYSATVRARKVETTTWAAESLAERQSHKELLTQGGTPAGSDASFAPIAEAMDEVVRDYADMRADAN